MSGLFGLLHVGATGLHAQGFGMSVASQNAQNANTEGYTRRDVRLSPIAPPPAGGGGVRVRGSRRIRDEFLDRRLLGASSARAEASSRRDALAILDQVLSEVEGGLANSLDDFEAAMQALTGNPGDAGTRSDVLAAAGRLAKGFVSAGREIDRTRDDIDGRIAIEIESVNERLEAIGKLSVQIQRAEIDGREASDLRDSRAQLVSEVAEILPISTIEDDQGGMNILLGGGLALVSPDGTASQLKTAADPGTGRLQIIRKTAGLDLDVTAAVDSGRLGGLVAARDGALLEAEASLDQLAFDVASAYNAVHTAGFGKDGATGRNLFDPIAGVAGAATAFAVSADVLGAPDRVAAATDPAFAAGDNRNALALAALAETPFAAGGTRTAQGSLAAMISAGGRAIDDANLDTSVTEDAEDQVRALRNSVSGVSMDEEMIALSRYQRGYEASLRVVQAADQMLQELLALGR